MLSESEKIFLEKAIDLSMHGMQKGFGGPFGCVIVQHNKIIGEGCNMVTSTNDPTAHAEIVAIREACRKIGHYQLDDCDIYSSCEPCPMCLGAIYWARPSRVIFANTRTDAADIDFDDEFIYKEFNIDFAERKIPLLHYPHIAAREVFDAWKKAEGKKQY